MKDVVLLVKGAAVGDGKPVGSAEIAAVIKPPDTTAVEEAGVIPVAEARNDPDGCGAVCASKWLGLNTSCRPGRMLNLGRSAANQACGCGFDTC